KVGDEIAVAGKAANSPTSEVKSSDTSEVFLGGQVSWQKIASIEYAGEEQVYDIEVSGTHNFVAGHYVNSRTQSVVPSTIEESLIQATDSSQKAEILQRQFGASDDVAFGGIVAHNTYISGNVGIGTTAPAAGLHVGTGGTPSFAGANDVYIQNDLEVGGTAYFGSVGATGSILPTTDNTYNLGSATYRWANLYLAPASLHISDTTGTSGAGTDYVDGSLLFSGEQFQLKTTLMGAQATGGNILLQSAYPAGGTTTPAIELKTSTDLATGDQLFRVGDSAANFLTITGAGNVGIGTTNPVQKLHVEGQCVAGDTVVYVEPPTSDIEPPSKAGFSGQEVQSSKFDVQNTAEVQEKQIKDVKEGDSVYGLNEENNSVEVFKVKALLDMGIQPVFKLKTTDGKEIKTTGNHPYLVIEKEGGDSDDTVAARKVRSLAAGDQVNQASLYSDRDVSQGRAVWLDRSDQPGSSIDSQQYCRGQRDVVDSRLCGVSLSSQRQSLRDSQLSINRQGVELSNRGTDEGGNGDSLYSTEEVSKLDNFTEKSSWKKVIYLEKGDLIAVSQIEPRTSNLEPYVLWAEIESIEYVGKEQVYDGTVDEFNKKN
ncbi:MAG: hypothetical protein COZ31_00715, partial [Nitrospirae bacterium CG_4_10_14_3_um_filter_44_29]